MQKSATQVYVIMKRTQNENSTLWSLANDSYFGGVVLGIHQPYLLRKLAVVG